MNLKFIKTKAFMMEKANAEISPADEANQLESQLLSAATGPNPETPTVYSADSIAMEQAEGTDSVTGNSKEDIIKLILAVMDSSTSESEDDETKIIQSQLMESDREHFNKVVLLSYKHERNCVQNYCTKVVPSYIEREFIMHFRISRNLFNNLCIQLESSEFYIRGNNRVSVEVHMLLFLWFAGHEACSFRDIADRFDLSLSTVSLIIHRVTMFLSSLSPQLIKWPNAQEKEKSSRFFENKCFFSKAIGCIDGTHIVIDPPRVSKDEYIDRKGKVSICLQGICNEEKKFIYIYVGHPGSCHDSWVFKNSPIHDNLPTLCEDYYLLGDSAYPCNKYVVTPYKDNGHLTQAQKTFNVKLSSGRIAIEHTFGILKQRFRQLYYCKLRSIKKLCHFVRACCVLHNIAHEDDVEFVPDMVVDTSDSIFDHGEITRGNAVRDPICQHIMSHLNLN